MIVKVRTTVIHRAFGYDMEKWPEHISDLFRYNNERKKEDVDFEKLKEADLKKIKIAAKELQEKFKEYEYQHLAGKVDTYFLLSNDIEGTEKANSLDKIPLVIKNFVAQHCPHRFLFRQTVDGVMLPYYLSDIIYTPQKRDRYGVYPAHTDMKLYYHERGEKKTISYTFHPGDKGNAKELLDMCGLKLENEAVIEDYRRIIRRYLEIQGQTGLQMSASGTARMNGQDRWGRSSYSSRTPMIRDGQMAKLVIDNFTTNGDGDEEEESGGSDKLFTDATFWKTNPNKFTLDESIEVEDVIGEGYKAYIPIHPIVKAFDLSKHTWFLINTEHLEDYKWDKELINKLILPEDNKTLINMLIESTKDSQEDIIKGKMSGVIVLATGLPGVGKTLTAEVFGEWIEKPLYSIQCSQLGLNIEEIEGNLKQALNRAGRWGAILLIDEADVYIRERGEDIQQNAIVGVFLRLIEYYSGVLFMTSNRGDIIDDAIISRSTAWIRYENPDTELLKKIWQVLGANYGKEFTKKEVDGLVKDDKLKSISGRTVRNLLKLAGMLASKQESEITVDLIKQVSSYQKLD